ncbi:hypothetical protein VTO42DRAFT_4963 [Malbranchea cinnamomea]
MILLLALTLSSILARPAYSLRVASGSPCWDTCSKPSVNTTGDDIVCRDYMFSEEEEGRRFEECVSCELESTHFLKRYDETDVEWGLYNLRYAVSTCIFGYPVEKQSLSTPCQVSCESLKDAIAYGLKRPNGFTAYDFCDLDSFDDNVVTKCAECYSQTADEKYMANFIEAIRQGCHNKVEPGFSFMIDPSRIFNTAKIPPSTESSAHDSEDGGGSGKPKNLVLIIVLPIVGFLLLLACFGCCCFFLIRRRRRKAKRYSHSQHLYERWNDTSIMTPFPGGLQKLWSGNPAMNPIQPPQSPYSTYDPRSYGQQQQQPGDIKYPPEAYVMGTSPSTPIAPQQQYQWPQQWPQQHPMQQPQEPQQPQQPPYVQTPQSTGTEQTQHVVVAAKQDTQVPILSAPLPPRKSIYNNPDESTS